MTLPGASSIPAVDSSHAVMATRTGKRIVEMVWEDMKPSDLITEDSIHNAIIADLAIGGSTNAIVHLMAMARRAGLESTWRLSIEWRGRRRCSPTSSPPARF